MIVSALAPSEIIIVGDITSAWHMFGPKVEAELKQNSLSKAPKLRPAYEGNTSTLTKCCCTGDECWSGLTRKGMNNYVFCCNPSISAQMLPMRIVMHFWEALTLGIFLERLVFVLRSRRLLLSAAQKAVPIDGNAAGDALDNPGPLATDLSPEIKPKAIAAAIKKVADWQVAYAEPKLQ